jgi:hypothetical protein
MPRFNQSEMIALLNDFENLTQKINAFLDRKEKPDDLYITQLSDLYRIRRTKLEFIDEWLKSPQGKEFLIKNKDYWNNYIKKISEIDQNSIKVIKNSVDNLNMELKQLLNNKNVLIYTKENKL